MSQKFQCQACMAIYTDTQPDGSLYFHACAVTVDPVTGVSTPIPGARNENLTIGRDWKATGIISAGAGTKPVKGQAAADPAWLNSLQVQLAKEQ